jgi:hypothetical protein
MVLVVEFYKNIKATEVAFNLIPFYKAIIVYRVME